MVRNSWITNLTNLILNLCYSYTIEYAVFMNLGLKGTDLIRNSYFTEILIKSDVPQLNYLVFWQGITLYYWHESGYKHQLRLILLVKRLALNAIINQPYVASCVLLSKPT